MRLRACKSFSRSLRRNSVRSPSSLRCASAVSARRPSPSAEPVDAAAARRASSSWLLRLAIRASASRAAADDCGRRACAKFALRTGGQTTHASAACAGAAFGGQTAIPTTCAARQPSQQ
eukprot:205648-Chlamydomonas_euryale.AAC.1